MTLPPRGGGGVYPPKAASVKIYARKEVFRGGGKRDSGGRFNFFSVPTYTMAPRLPPARLGEPLSLPLLGPGRPSLRGELRLSEGRVFRRALFRCPYARVKVSREDAVAVGGIRTAPWVLPTNVGSTSRTLRSAPSGETAVRKRCRVFKNGVELRVDYIGWNSDDSVTIYIDSQGDAGGVYDIVGLSLSYPCGAL